MSVKVGRKALCGLRQITHQTFLGLLRPGFASCCHAAKHTKRKWGALPIPSGSGPLNQTQVLQMWGHQTAESIFQKVCLGPPLLGPPVYPYAVLAWGGADEVLCSSSPLTFLIRNLVEMPEF